jgi:two-component system nitrate/nitrite response regulator NarL
VTAQTIDLATSTERRADAVSPSQTTIATVLTCDNALLHTGLEHILSGSAFVVAKVIPATGLRLVGKGVVPPALIIVAANQSSGRMVEMIRQAKEQYPQARIVALADQFDPDGVWQGREAGADGFCQTTMNREALIASLELVMLGEGVLPAALVAAMLDGISTKHQSQPISNAALMQSDLRAHKLSAREAEILTCLKDGAPNKVIARKLDVAEATVKVHVKAILRKLGAANRTQAAMWATAHLPRPAAMTLSG